jgi:hypothetical protein
MKNGASRRSSRQMVQVESLFPYSLAGEAKTWYSFASFEVGANWNKLMKKFCDKFFPISKAQHLRRHDQLHTRRRGRDRPSL